VNDIEKNKAIVIRLFDEGVNRQDLVVLRELLGSEEMVALWCRKFEAFPDLRLDVLDVVAEDDRVCTRGVIRGTHKVSYRGIEASGRAVELHYIDIWRVTDGVLVDNWAEWDVADALNASTKGS
jgi:predicted ester cyclase